MSPPTTLFGAFSLWHYGLMRVAHLSLSKTPQARPKCTAAGLTLLEVLISLGIFAITATSIVAVTFRIRSMSEQTIYQNTALVLAQGYVEQLRSVDYTTLSSAAQSSTVALPLLNASGATATDTSGGSLGNNDWSSEVVYLDEDSSGNPIQPLTFRFQPVLNLLTSSTAAGVEITVNYETTYNFGVTKTFSGSLRTVRSGIPTY